MKILRRIRSGLLCALLLCLLVPCYAFADDGTDSLQTISGTLDLSSAADRVEGTGYIWEPDGEDSYVLTLKSVQINGDQTDPNNNESIALILPNEKKVTIRSEGASVLEGGITVGLLTADNPYRSPLNLVFDGAVLTINGQISNGTNNDSVTVQNGANVVVRDGFNMGASFTGSRLYVDGTGTCFHRTQWS